MIAKFDVVVIGAGPAGLAAARSARDQGASTLIIDRENHLGGILHQCIHPGFGLQEFGEELTGPEYAHRLASGAVASQPVIWQNSMVLNLNGGASHRLLVANPGGLREVEAKTVVLAMGCRERTRANIAIPGHRPAGVFTAGTAQRWINVEGYQVGRKVVILGSGDIGLIMARRLRLEGAEVVGVVELMPYETGLKRNVVQCLDDFNIPLFLGHTVTAIHGQDRVEGVTVCRVDRQYRPLPETAQWWECDTLLLSVGLIPENELSKQAGVTLDSRTGGPVVNQNYATDVPGIFACGNVLHVNDLADNAAIEGYRAGKEAAFYANTGYNPVQKKIVVRPGENVRYVVPQVLELPLTASVELSLRVVKPLANAKAILRQGEQAVKVQPLGGARPGEMLQIKVPDGIIKDEDNLEVAVAGEVS